MLAAPPSVGPTLDHRTAGYKRVIYRVRRGHPLATLALRLHGLPDAARGSLPGESADQHPRTARPRALMIKPLTGVGAENGARGPGGGSRDALSQAAHTESSAGRRDSLPAPS